MTFSFVGPEGEFKTRINIHAKKAVIDRQGQTPLAAYVKADSDMSF